MTDPFAIHHEDCVSGMARMRPKSVGLTMTSVPYESLFTYSGEHNDMGNCPSTIDLRSGEFGLHLRFFCEALLRVMMPGRTVAIHIQQLITTKVQHGFMGRRDFRGGVIDVFTSAGFLWTGEVAIPKNPQAIARRQKLHSLQFKTGRKDANRLRPAVQDYLLIFDAPGEDPEPVPSVRYAEKEPPFRELNPGGWVSERDWIAWAHGSWTDICEIDILEGFRAAREEDDEKHVCPLQLEVIRRPIMLWTNPGDLVLDPFMGVGSTAWVALGGPTKIGKLRVNAPRRVVGFELKGSYHALAVRNAQTAVDNWAEFVDGDGQGELRI